MNFVDSLNPPPYVLAGGRRYVIVDELCMTYRKVYDCKEGPLTLRLTFPTERDTQPSVIVAWVLTGKHAERCIRMTTTSDPKEPPHRLMQRALKTARTNNEELLSAFAEQLQRLRGGYKEALALDKVLADALNSHKPKRPAPLKKDKKK